MPHFYDNVLCSESLHAMKEGMMGGAMGVDEGTVDRAELEHYWYSMAGDRVGEDARVR